MQKLFLLLAIFGVGYITYFLYLKNMKAPTQQQKIKAGLIFGGLVFVILALTGRAPAIFAAIGAIMTAAFRYYPLILRHLPELRRAYRSVSGQSAAPKSKVSTAAFVMSLDHESGHMDAEITTGSFSGKSLSELNIEDLKAFYRYCQTCDQQTIQVLEAYIQRERLAEWQDAPQSEQTSTASASTSEGEALDILGLEPGADKQAIVDAHRRLMSRMHPDKGGSNYLAAKINKAKEVLLSRQA